jgi:FMN-dependent NADH-azoreductase
LKQWIDIISQPGWLFGFTPDAGYSGLILGKKAAVIYTSGVYAPGAPLPMGPTSTPRSSTTGSGSRASPR